jgi:hypothetical protein
MGSLIICNVFTLAMLPEHEDYTITAYALTEEEAKEVYLNEGDTKDSPIIQAIGHQGTCDVLREKYGWNVEFARTNVKLTEDDYLLVAQVQTPRLAEGQILTTEQVKALPITFRGVTVKMHPKQ